MAYCCVLTLLSVVSTSQMLTGLFSMIHQMTPRTISIELVEQLEVLKELVEHSYSFMSMKSDF